MTARSARGVTLLETTIALGVLLIALAGLAQLQVVAARANHAARKTSLASMLARDLVESVSLWGYRDPRLAILDRVPSLTDDRVQYSLDPGSEVQVPSDRIFQFAERTGDANATNAGALGTYLGVSSDLDADGTFDFSRYWSVFGLDPDGDGQEDLKFVVVVVRWKEPGWGMRNVVETTVRHDAAQGIVP